ncbi:IS30 family transposase, partial [Psychrobacter sp. Sarcosine-02u-2]
LLQAKKGMSEIARIIGCHKSTVSREIKRNMGQRGYRPKQAHRLAKERKVVNSAQISRFGWCYIEHLLNKRYSPEQITGRLR